MKRLQWNTAGRGWMMRLRLSAPFQWKTSSWTRCQLRSHVSLHVCYVADYTISRCCLFFPFSVDSNPDLDFETFDLDRMASENYEDDMIRSRYKLEDSYFSNDIPFLFSTQGNRRRRRGIVDECCRKPCFKTDLIRYCPTRKSD